MVAINLNYQVVNNQRRNWQLAYAAKKQSLIKLNTLKNFTVKKKKKKKMPLSSIQPITIGNFQTRAD